ncbi:hypothetical protein Z962_05815 [Clostridium botulinum C/D str. BKT12695]|nr:hypothetical protein Z962_05815 [Clostridium botulinum C/D str. BKT12695]
MKKFDNHKNIYKYIEHILDYKPEYETHMIISNLYKYLENYLNLVSIQFERINQTYIDLDPLSNHSIKKFEDKLLFTKLFGDIHFLLISAEKAYNISMNLYKKLSLKQKSIEIHNSKTYTNLKKIRNMLEHMDENLMDGLDKSKKIIPHYSYSNVNWFDSQYGTLSDNTIKLKNYEFKIEEKSLEYLYNCYDNITYIITSRYVLPIKKEVDDFWNAFYQNVHTN